MKSKKLEKQNLLQAEQELLSMYRKNNVEDKTHIYEFIKNIKMKVLKKIIQSYKCCYFLDMHIFQLKEL